MTTFSIGVATADITPPVGCAMGGYGARKGTAQSVAMPLRCRAFVFGDGSSSVALVVCDLLFVTYDITSRARALIAAELGLPPNCVMITGTHTHSGPAGLTVRQDPVFVESASKKIAGSVIAAFQQREATVLKYVETTVSSISQNRRDPDGPIETTARLLVAEAIEVPRTLATIVNYACHATVLEHDNLALSPDFPGAMVEAVEQNVGGQAAYLQGCAGSINPVWMRHDHSEARRVGSILGLAAARAVHESLPLGRGQWSVNLSLAADVPKPPTGCRDVPAGLLAGVSVKTPLLRRTRPSVGEAEEELKSVDAKLDSQVAPEERKHLLARRAALRMEAHFGRRPYPYAEHGDRGDEEVGRGDQVEVQALVIGAGTAIVGIPGEPFLGIGEEVRRRATATNVLVAGYANEAIGYIPLATDFPHDGYEVGCAHYTPEAAEALVVGALSALDAATAQAQGEGN